MRRYRAAMAQPSVFGDIPGVLLGDHFASRAAVRQAGLHRHNQHGISGDYAVGADAVVVSGGYPDDRDYGDRIVYTGHGGLVGGHQVADQQLTGGNRALALSEEAGLPVRVIRGAGGDPEHSPATGYTYCGLYTVTEHWQERSLDGPLIWRFALEEVEENFAWSPLRLPTGVAHPERAQSVVQRVVRNSAVRQAVKDLHAGRCQFCGITLETAAGYYAEAAHIRALGHPHDGPDSPDNVLCLCPNDHVLFDKGALYLAEGKVWRSEDRSVVGVLRTEPGHDISEDHITYHREHFARVF
jgi:putative restriction endonuclease